MIILEANFGKIKNYYRAEPQKSSISDFIFKKVKS